MESRRNGPQLSSRHDDDDDVTRNDSTDVFKMYKGFTRLDTCELFVKDTNIKGARGHTSKLDKGGV